MDSCVNGFALECSADMNTIFYLESRMSRFLTAVQIRFILVLMSTDLYLLAIDRYLACLLAGRANGDIRNVCSQSLVVSLCRCTRLGLSSISAEGITKCLLHISVNRSWDDLSIQKCHGEGANCLESGRLICFLSCCKRAYYNESARTPSDEHEFR